MKSDKWNSVGLHYVVDDISWPIYPTPNPSPKRQGGEKMQIIRWKNPCSYQENQFHRLVGCYLEFMIITS